MSGIVDDQSNVEEDTTSLVLHELGLNEYEIRAFLTILEGGTVVAREISDRSSIPYAKVYQVLESLVSKQFIIGDEGRPRKFRGRDPSDSLNDRLVNLQSQWEKSHSKRKKLVELVLPEFQNMFKTSHVEAEREEGVWQINGLTNILSRLTKLIQNTNSTLRISTSNPSFLISKLGKNLSETRKKVVVSIKVTQDNEDLYEFGKVQIVDRIGNSTSLIFDDFAQLSIIESNRGKYTQGEFKGVLTQIEQIVETSIIDYDS